MSNLLYKDTVYIYIVLQYKTISIWKVSFLNFNSNSLKVLDCLIYLGKLFYGTALPNLTLRLQ